MSGDREECSPGRDLARRASVPEEHVRAVRVGHGANCSSIGSVIDTLFATATLGAAIFAAVAAALSNEEVKVVGEDDDRSPALPEPGPNLGQPQREQDKGSEVP